MNEPTLDVLAGRVERLERENRYWRMGAMAALFGLLALLLMGQARPSFRTLESERVVVKDKAGRVRVALGAIDGGSDAPNPLYGLAVYDPSGEKTAYIYDWGTLGGATLNLLGSHSTIQMSATKEPSVKLEAYDESRTERNRRLDRALREALDKKAFDEYGRSSRRGVTAVSLAVESAQPSVSLTAKDGEQRAVFGASAWVLWAEWGGGWTQAADGTRMIPPLFKPLSAHESRAECDRAQRTYQLSQGYSRVFCLPDTIDARGPKREGSR